MSREGSQTFHPSDDNNPVEKFLRVRSRKPHRRGEKADMQNNAGWAFAALSARSLYIPQSRFMDTRIWLDDSICYRAKAERLIYEQSRSCGSPLTSASVAGQGGEMFTIYIKIQDNNALQYIAFVSRTFRRHDNLTPRHTWILRCHRLTNMSKCDDSGSDCG